MSQEQIQKFNEMYNWFKQMQASSSIPRATEMAVRERLGDLGIELFISSANPSSYNQTTSSGGGDTVPQAFDGFKATSTGLLIPYYNP